MNYIRLHVLYVLLELLPARYGTESETGRIIPMRLVFSWLFTVALPGRFLQPYSKSVGPDIAAFQQATAEIFNLIREGVAKLVVIEDVERVHFPPDTGTNHLSIGPRAMAVLNELKRQYMNENRSQYGGFELLAGSQIEEHRWEPHTYILEGGQEISVEDFDASDADLLVVGAYEKCLVTWGDVYELGLSFPDDWQNPDDGYEIEREIELFM